MITRINREIPVTIYTFGPDGDSYPYVHEDTYLTLMPESKLTTQTLSTMLSDYLYDNDAAPGEYFALWEETKTTYIESEVVTIR